MGGGIIVSQNNQTGIIQVLFGTERSLPVLTYTITDDCCLQNAYKYSCAIGKLPVRAIQLYLYIDLLLLAKCIQVLLCRVAEAYQNAYLRLLRKRLKAANRENSNNILVRRSMSRLAVQLFLCGRKEICSIGACPKLSDVL